jgi:hypothetical protein
MKQIFLLIIILALIVQSCKKNDFSTGNEDGVNIPNQVDPNGDGINEVWRITTPDGTDGRIVITDPNNLVVFETGDITDGWAPSVDREIFHYFIKLRFADGTKKKYTGSILVLE